MKGKIKIYLKPSYPSSFIVPPKEFSLDELSMEDSIINDKMIILKSVSHPELIRFAMPIENLLYYEILVEDKEDE